MVIPIFGFVLQEDEDAVNVQDKELMLGLLDTVVILWTVIEPALQKVNKEV